MTVTTPAEQLTIRTHPQQTQLHLGIFTPRVVFRCKLNNVNAARGDRTIPYDSVSAGSYLNVEAGMSLYVESSVGARDLGRVRIKSVTASEFTVAENSDIPWFDNADLFVLRSFPVDAVYPRIIHDPSNAENVIFYKDYDIAYTDQNSILGAFVNMGPHRMIFRDCASGIAESYWSSSGTSNLANGTGSYQWTFEGGTPTGSTLSDPGIVSYSTPGHYVTKLVVSGTNGSVDTAYRYVSVYDYPGCGTGTPPLRWDLNEAPQGSRGEGGHNIRVTLHEIVDIHEGDVVMLFAEDWYGSTKQSFGGNHPNNSQMFFVGYILNDTIRFNYKNSTVEFQAGSITQYMKQMEGFSISVESSAAPATWYELLDMDVRRAMYHYLRWQSTVLTTNDFEFKGTDQKIQFFDADRSSVYDAVDSLMRSALMGEIVSDRQGKIWAEIQAPLTPNATGTYVPIMELSKQDWMSEPRLEERLSNQTSFIELGGIAYAGTSTGTYSALMSNAPGAAPAYRGKVTRQQGLALSSQTQLNQLSGDLFAMNNSRFPTIDIEMSGNYRNLDIAPQESVLVNLLPEDTMKGVQIRSPYFPYSINWTWEKDKQLLYPRTTFNVITSGRAGETIPIPDVPPGDGFNVPRVRTPTVPQITFPSMFGFGVSSYIIYYQLNDLNSNDMEVVRAKGEFLGYPDLVRAVGRVGTLVIPSAGLYVISFTANLSAPDASPFVDTVYWRIRETDTNGVEIQQAIVEFDNLDTTSARRFGKSITVFWYVTGGHNILFERDSALTTIQAAHASVVKLANA